MYRTITVAVFFVASAVSVRGQVVMDSSLLLASRDVQWWRNAKFGLFIHYGLYSVLGQGEKAGITLTEIPISQDEPDQIIKLKLK